MYEDCIKEDYKKSIIELAIEVGIVIEQFRHTSYSLSIFMYALTLDFIKP